MSNLTFVSKLLERILSGQLTTFLESSNAIPESQSSYIRFHSTESALLKVFSDLNIALAHARSAAWTYRSQRRFWHSWPWRVAEMTGDLLWSDSVPLQWLNSYLVGRVQTIVINRSRLSAIKLSCGVPQGSVLGPILFALYTKDVSVIIKRHGLWSHCYADDTQIYFYC